MSRTQAWAMAALVVALIPGSTCREADVKASLDQEVVLRRGQWASFGGRPLEIAFLRVVADSRCPTNAQCIHAGSAVVQFQGKSSEGGFDRFTAELPGGAAPSDSIPWTTWGAYHVKVVRLEPYPRVGVEVDSSAFVATFVVREH